MFQFDFTYLITCIIQFVHFIVLNLGREAGPDVCRISSPKTLGEPFFLPAFDSGEKFNYRASKVALLAGSKRLTAPAFSAALQINNNNNNNCCTIAGRTERVYQVTITPATYRQNLRVRVQ